MKIITKRMKDYKLVDHTADLGIEVVAPDLPSLFVKCGRAMFDVIAQPVGSDAETGSFQYRDISLTAGNLGELMVCWLGELLSLFDCYDLIFVEYTIKDLTETSICARVGGSPREKFEIIREVKAVTYHDLKVEKRPEGWLAHIIFDV